MAPPRTPQLPRRLRRPKPGSGDFEWDGADYRDGNRLTLYSRAENLYAAMAAAIEDARETVHLETYILGDDRVGRTFAELLSRRARAGTRVRLIYDAVGSIDLDPALLTRMRNAGVQALEYHPMAPWRPRWSWNRRDHRKILVCDGRVGFAGGMNLCDEHLPAEEGGGGWQDVHARVEGPAACDLDGVFRETWLRQTGRAFEPAGDLHARVGGARVKVAANQEFLRRLEIREAYVNALRAARSEVLIANSYFLPGRRISRALAAAARRGVSVRALVPGRLDSEAVRLAVRARYGRLLSRGVRLFEWQGAMMHAKAVVVDRRWSAVGSYNLDYRSLRHNLEVNLHSLDADFAASLAELFERALSGAREITLEAWRRRPLADKILERAASLFAYFF